MKVLLIDNGTKLLEKLQSLIPGSEITKKWKDLEITDANKFDLVVLSGSSTSSVIWNYEDFQNEIQLIKNSTKPIIGLCFGCELIVRAFGGSVKELISAHEGIREINVIDSRFSSKNKLSVYEHHRWGINRMPEGFTILAESVDGPEAIRSKTLPIFGLMFHPENFVNETEGKEVFDELIKGMGFYAKLSL